MIRRGLQIIVLVGITALGAAPCFGQTYPMSVSLSGFPLIGGASPNGYYVRTSTGGAFASGTYVQYDGETNAFFLDLRAIPDGSSFRWGGALRTSPTATPVATRGTTTAPLVTGSAFTGVMGQWHLGNLATFPGSGALAGSVIFDGDFAYRTEFPDWASAGVKIPLGFTFGMTFWAAAVALTISLKWVRDLASAAS